MDATGWAGPTTSWTARTVVGACAWVRSGSYVAQGDTDLPCVGDFEEHYAGEWVSFRDYAFQLAELVPVRRSARRPHRRQVFQLGQLDLRSGGDFTVVPTGRGSRFIFRDL